MTRWTVLQPSRHQVAIAGLVSDAQTGQVIVGAEVKLGRGSVEFQRWLAIKAIQHGDSLSRQGFAALSPVLTLVLDQSGVYLMTRTAQQGHFYFSDLLSGVYSLSVSLPAAGTRYGTRQIDQVEVSQHKPAVADLTLPPTGIKGRIISPDSQPVVMAKIQSEGSNIVTFSDRNGDYCLSGLEVWQASGKALDSPRPLITVSAQGYESTQSGAWLTVGEIKPLNITLVRKS